MEKYQVVGIEYSNGDKTTAMVDEFETQTEAIACAAEMKRKIPKDFFEVIKNGVSIKSF